VGATGQVLGLDFVEEMLAFAREKAASLGLKNVEFRRMDGEELEAPAGSFDAVTMRWGLMFMPDPVACLKRALGALKKGGTFTTTCWAAPEKNPWASLPLAVLKRHMEVPTPPPGAPGLFAFADPSRLRTTIEAAGFSDVQVEPVELNMCDFDKGAEYVAYTLELAGPIAVLFHQLTKEQQSQVAKEMAGEAERIGGGRVVLPGLTWLATARA
jgi:SAM-dependent methyltransferase